MHDLETTIFLFFFLYILLMGFWSGVEWSEWKRRAAEGRFMEGCGGVCKKKKKVRINVCEVCAPLESINRRLLQ